MKPSRYPCLNAYDNDASSRRLFQMIAQPTVRVGLISLGCPKNLVDSEVMLGSLVEKGFELSSSVDNCDIAVINTCAFIGQYSFPDEIVFQKC